MNPKCFPYLSLFVFMSFVLFPNLIVAENLSSNKTMILDSSEFEVWIDSFSQLTSFEEIVQKEFQKSPTPQSGNTKHAYWFKFNLENKQEQPLTYWLHVGVFDSLTLIRQHGDSLRFSHRGLLADYTIEDKRHFRQLQQYKYGFEITIPPHSNITCFLRVKNTVRFETTFDGLKVMKKEQLLSEAPAKALYFGIFNAFFFGILFFLILFSLSQHFQARDASYLYYTLYLSLTIVYFWWKFEKANSFFNIFFTAFPKYYYYYEAPLSVLIYIGYFLFVARFLNAKVELPSFYRILRFLTPILAAYFAIAFLIAAIWGLDVGWEFIYWIRLVLIPTAVVAIFLVFKARHQLGFYVLMGALFMLLGAAVTTYLSKALSNHYAGPWDLPLLPIQLGVLLETFFFSIGLGYKSRLSEQEKTVALLDLQEKKKEAEYLKKRKTELTNLYANLSHEFRTPLAVVLGATKQIEGYPKERELIERNGGQLLRLINKILDVNKIEANKMQINWRREDAMRFIRYSAESFELLAKQKKQSLEVVCSPQTLLMDIDRDKFQKIINNLLSNAVKFTPIKGSIRVCASKLSDGEQETLRLEVSDSGPGIPENYRRLIFDPFIQTPNTEGGTGLGLTLVKQFTRLLGGEVLVNSAPDKGSAFILNFPIRRQAPLADLKQLHKIENRPLVNLPSMAEPGQIAASRSSVLLIEDNEDVLQYLKQLLRARYNVFSAKDGQTGFDMARQIRPDVIISDVMMPGMNGYELCRKLKNTVLTQNIPIILATARASRPDKLQGLKSEADAYLIKPFDEEELLIRVQGLLQKRRQLKKQVSGVFSKHGSADQTENEAVLFMEKLHAILEDHLQNEGFKIKELCRELGVNHVTLNNKIKEYTGKTTARYIRNYRLQYAKKLLRTTQLSVAQISYKVGISEPANFNNLFKKIFGKSPKQWREG